MQSLWKRMPHSQIHNRTSRDLRAPIYACRPFANLIISAGSRLAAGLTFKTSLQYLAVGVLFFKSPSYYLGGSITSEASFLCIIVFCRWRHVPQ